MIGPPAVIGRLGTIPIQSTVEATLARKVGGIIAAASSAAYLMIDGESRCYAAD